jgi:ubiquinone/menaquinone biosynthesis C-methylase UbiE
MNFNEKMNFKNNFFRQYFNQTPLALARERATECYIFSKMVIEEPVLDLGCGEGLFSSILFSNKVQVGIDPNSRELRRAGEFGCYRTLICCAGDSVPLPNESIRTIISNSTLEHIPNLEPVLKEMSRLLIKDGSFILTVPSDEFYKASFLYKAIFQFIGKNARDYYRQKYNKFWKHFHDYKPETWVNLFNSNGWAVESMKRYNSKSATLINDILVPFAIIGLLNKKINNKWIRFAKVREMLFKFLPNNSENSIQKNSHDDDGTLIVFRLKKY